MVGEWCRRICIIAEGNEEKYYLERIVAFHYFDSENFCISSIKNAHGIDRIFSLFQDAYSGGAYDLIIIFCDGDNNSSQFKKMKNRIDEELFGGNDVANHIVFFANPVTLQIVLSHFDKVILTHKSKANNSSVVESITGIVNYKAKEEQILEMVSHIKYDSYHDMKKNLSTISKSVDDTPSTNFLDLIDVFENDDIKKIDDLINLLNEK